MVIRCFWIALAVHTIFVREGIVVEVESIWVKVIDIDEHVGDANVIVIIVIVVIIIDINVVVVVIFIITIQITPIQIRFPVPVPLGVAVKTFFQLL